MKDEKVSMNTNRRTPAFVVLDLASLRFMVNRTDETLSVYTQNMELLAVSSITPDTHDREVIAIATKVVLNSTKLSRLVLTGDGRDAVAHLPVALYNPYTACIGAKTGVYQAASFIPLAQEGSVIYNNPSGDGFVIDTPKGPVSIHVYDPTLTSVTAAIAAHSVV